MQHFTTFYNKITNKSRTMKIEIKLVKTRKETAEGFPVVIEISHQNKRKTKHICFCKDKHFIKDGKSISEKHPDYDLLMPILMDLKLRARKLILLGCTDVGQAYLELFNASVTDVLFLDYGRELVAEMKKTAALANNDIKAQNKLLGNIKCYEYTIASFANFGGNVSFQNLNYEILMRFRNHHLALGNTKSTVHFYLRTLRSIYNKGIWKYKFTDLKPFVKVFDGLKIRSYDSRKKSLNKDSIRALEMCCDNGAKQKYLDLFLLQFYFGGCDLMDLYYLEKKQVRNGRVVLERSKVSGGPRIDLKIHPKAQKLMKKYEVESGNWFFSWKKEKQSYETFRNNGRRALVEIQEKENIIVLPDGGNIGSKVARHTFATIAKKLMIEPDIIRELMGHERDEVDNYYKDKYPEQVRDDALFEIISSFECVK